MNRFQEIIDAFPRREDVAISVGVSLAVVHKWRQRDNIPAEYDLRLVAAAEKFGVPVSLGMLASIRNSKLDASSDTTEAA